MGVILRVMKSEGSPRRVWRKVAKAMFRAAENPKNRWHARGDSFYSALESLRNFENVRESCGVREPGTKEMNK